MPDPIPTIRRLRFDLPDPEPPTAIIEGGGMVFPPATIPNEP